MNPSPSVTSSSYPAQQPDYAYRGSMAAGSRSDLDYRPLSEPGAQVLQRYRYSRKPGGALSFSLPFELESVYHQFVIFDPAAALHRSTTERTWLRTPGGGLVRPGHGRHREAALPLAGVRSAELSA